MQGLLGVADRLVAHGEHWTGAGPVLMVTCTLVPEATRRPARGVSAMTVCAGAGEWRWPKRELHVGAPGGGGGAALALVHEGRDAGVGGVADHQRGGDHGAEQRDDDAQGGGGPAAAPRG